jgi:transcriptional regulator with XRE-family HTH domain
MNRGALRLGSELKERGSRKKLAKEMDVDAGRVSRWLSGELTPNTAHRMWLQERFGIPWPLWDRAVPGKAAQLKAGD